MNISNKHWDWKNSPQIDGDIKVQIGDGMTYGDIINLQLIKDIKNLVASMRDVSPLYPTPTTPREDK